jgi:hypothetical protein
MMMMMMITPPLMLLRHRFFSSFTTNYPDQATTCVSLTLDASHHATLSNSFLSRAFQTAQPSSRKKLWQRYPDKCAPSHQRHADAVARIVTASRLSLRLSGAGILCLAQHTPAAARTRSTPAPRHARSFCSSSLKPLLCIESGWRDCSLQCAAVWY